MQLFDVRIIYSPKDGEKELLVVENDILAKDSQTAERMVVAKHGATIGNKIKESDVIVRSFRG